MDFKPRDDYSDEAYSHMTLAYIYMMSKYVDMLDTVFFVLRKKQNQVTGLHVYHHSMVPTMGWIYFRINALHATAGAFAFLNSPIHTIMYAYYGLAAIGPHMQKYLWWKRYITQIQIAQFVLLFCHGVYFCLFQEGYHLFFSCDILFQTILYLYLFTQFYFRAYSTTKKETNRTKIELADSKTSTLPSPILDYCPLSSLHSSQFLFLGGFYVSEWKPSARLLLLTLDSFSQNVSPLGWEFFL